MKRVWHRSTVRSRTYSPSAERARLGRRRPPRPRSAWWPLYHRGAYGWVVHPALAGLFLGLAVFAHSLQADSLDLHITREIQLWTGLDGLLQAVSWLGYSPQDVVVNAIGIIALFLARHRHAALWLTISVAGSAALNMLVKMVVARPRPSPSLVHVLRHSVDFSFPSGHVMSYCSYYGFLIAVAIIEIRRPLARALIVLPCAALILLVGPSRIYLGAHWASDVLGAYLLGGLWLSIIVQLYSGRFALPAGDAGPNA